MDYAAFGFVGLCLLIAVGCAVIAAHRGGTMKFELPFITFDGEGLALTRTVRVLFALLAFAVLGIALVWILAVEAPDGGQAPQASGEPTATAPVEPSGRDGSAETPDSDTHGDSGDENVELVEAWSGCEFELHYRAELGVSSDGCPAVTDDSGGISVEPDWASSEPSGTIIVPSRAFATIWEKETPPSGEQCRTELRRGGQPDARIGIDGGTSDLDICLRSESGNRYLHLRINDVSFQNPEVYTVAGTVTAWDVTGR